MMLSTINWVNKGSGAGVLDTDDFNAVYGASATIARNIVQRAIDDWERVIVNFNGLTPLFLPRNTFDLTIDAQAFAGGLRGSTGSISYDALGKPSSATIQLDDNGGGSGWYFDSVPGSATVPDDGEFTTAFTTFGADLSGTADVDFYRTALHEIGHAMGLASSSPFITSNEVDVGDDPNSSDPADRLVQVTAGATTYTLTTNGGRHFFEGGGAYGGPIHPNDLLNPGRTIPTTVVRRLLISDTLATFLRDAYSYTVTMPSLINTMYVNLNTTTNVVTINGDIDPTGDDADVIDLEVDGTAMSFEVNGTDEVIEGAQFTTIIVNAANANGDVDVDALLSGKSVTVNGGAGNDNISAAQELQDIDTNLGSNFTANGDTGTDTLVFNDQSDGSGGDDYTITSTTFTKNASVINRVITYGTFESMIINGSPFASTYDINSLSSTLTSGLTINAGAANDTITVGGTSGDIDSLVNASVIVHGNGGIDTIHFNDVTDDASVDDSYTLTSIGFDKSSTSETFGFDTVENVILTAGLADNAIDVLSMSAVTSPDLDTLVINGNDGNDAINFSNGDLDDSLAFVAITVNGQAGTDSLYLNDSTDDTGADSYTLSSTTFDKNSAGVDLITYGTVESLTLDASGFNNVINLNTLSVPATVRGNGGNDTINIASGDVDNNILANVSVSGGAGTDAMVFDDTTDGATQDDWSITSTAIIKNFAVNRTFNYSALEGITINASAQANNYEIGSTLPATPVVINGGAGNESFNVGTPGDDVGGVDGALTLNGNGGTDTLNYNDSANAAATTYTLTATTIDRTGAATTTYGTMEAVVLNAGGGGDTINVNGSAGTSPVTVNAGGGNDSIVVGNGDWDSSVFSNVSIAGGAGTDSVRIDDLGDTVADNYVVNSTNTTKSSTASVIGYSTIESYTLDANNLANTITVESAFNNYRINGNGAADVIDVEGNQVGTFLTVDGGAGLDTVRLNDDGVGVVAVQFVNSQDLSRLQLFNGSQARVNAGADKVIDTSLLSIQGNGRLDLNDNDMIVRGETLATITSYLTSGLTNGGAFDWLGAGIGSTRANAQNTGAGSFLYGLGVILNDLAQVGGAGPIYPAFSGIGGLVGTEVLVKFTYFGDADLSGAIDATDYSLIDNGFVNGLSNWIHGDFDYSGGIDATDYALIDNAFVNQSGVLAASELIAQHTRQFGSAYTEALKAIQSGFIG
ncbi:beta strand repeat-containing protein [Fontivita pretiosa]|uniref:beta strand repeat-containing protein n=1 Tax=Fontivita pretiosa TaxID=2989684 RepID=UPI003D175C98